jgi:4'-phosphopantetheinyl transferase
VDALVLWLTQTLDDVPADDDWLADGERTTMERFRVPKRRLEWRLGRWVAKQALAAFLGPGAGTLASLEITAAQDGAPEASIAGEPAPVSISISHSGGIGLAAIARAGIALGCDVESVDRRSIAFVTDYFTAAEAAWVDRAGDDRDLLSTLVWSAKESALKALRTGLRADTRSIEVLVQDNPAGDDWGALRFRPAPLWGWWRLEGSSVITVASDVPTEPPRRAEARPTGYSRS